LIKPRRIVLFDSDGEQCWKAGRPVAQLVEKNQFKAGSIGFPSKLWRILERLQRDRMDPSLSATIEDLLLGKLAEMHYLNEEEKKALGI